MLDAALRYASVGWPVFPCREGEKEPATRHGFQDATTDSRQIERWFGKHPERNVAIATGAPGPDVLDVDDHKEKGNGFGAYSKLKRAGLVEGHMALVRTPSGGFHAYFRGSDQASGRRQDQHIDFRSAGGYVVAPPSQFEGRDYVLVDHQAASRGVDWQAIIRELDPPQAQRRRPQRDPGRRADNSDVDRLVNWVSTRPEGNRDFPVFYAAKHIEAAGLLNAANTERLVDAALRAGLRGGEREARRSIESGRRAAQGVAEAGRVPERQREPKPAQEPAQPSTEPPELEAG